MCSVKRLQGIPETILEQWAHVNLHNDSHKFIDNILDVVDGAYFCEQFQLLHFHIRRIIVPTVARDIDTREWAPLIKPEALLACMLIWLVGYN